MHRSIAAVTFFLALAASAVAHAFVTQDEVSRFMTTYYQHPDPARVPEVITSASRMGAFQGGRAAAPFFGFLAGAIRRDPSIVAELPELARQIPNADQPILVLGLWYSGHPDTKKLLGELATVMPSQKRQIDGLLANPAAPKLLDIPLDRGPWVQDALWGVFTATGAEDPVVRVMSALPWTNLQGDERKRMLGDAAKLTLTSNARRDPYVLGICKGQITRQPQDVAAVLAIVIADATSPTQPNPMPARPAPPRPAPARPAPTNPS